MARKTSRQFVPKALRDVWAWKDQIYNEVKHLPVDKALSKILDRAERVSRETKRRPHRRGKLVKPRMG